MNDWDELSAFLKKIFQPINEGEELLTPEEFWNRYGPELSQLNLPVIKDKLTELSEGVWIPKPYEALRVLKNIRQRRLKSDGHPDDGRPLVDSVRVEIQSRHRPIWEHSANELDGDKYNRDKLALIADIPESKRYSKFQVEGWLQLGITLKNRKSLVIVAPTGAGKTEVFLVPLIASIANAIKDGKPNQPHYVLIYPRVALLKDQLSRVFKYAFNAPSVYGIGEQKDLFKSERKQNQPIIIGLQYSGIASSRQDTFNKYRSTNSQERNTAVFDENGYFLSVPKCPVCESAKLKKGKLEKGKGIPLKCTNEVCTAIFYVTISREDHEKVKPHILVTTIESLDQLYLNPKIKAYLSNLDAIIFDEAHLYSSLYGAHVSNIIRRIEKDNIKEHGKPLAKIASSATISNPERFVAKLFYGDEKHEDKVFPHDAKDFPSESGGLEAVIFLRSPAEIEGKKVLPPQATLIQTAMAMGHGVLGKDDRIILFTESVDHVSRTQFQLRNAENEQNLWKFRTLVDQIEFDGNSCPRTCAYDCKEIYQIGKCWRGVLGGKDCIHFDEIRENPINVNKVSSKDPNDPLKGDLVVATASLEVGVDDPNFRATIHYRPPLNVFSFIQRRGRAGRKYNDIAYTVMVLGNDPIDEFYFRRRNRLMDGSHYELPLNPQNAVVQRMHERLEVEKNRIEDLASQYNNIPKAVLVWTLDKLRQCTTLNRLFGSELNNIYQKNLDATGRGVGTQEAAFRRWVNEQYVEFTKYLNLEIALQELETQIPSTEKQQVLNLRTQINSYREGDYSVTTTITELAIELESRLARILIAQHTELTNEEKRRLRFCKNQIESVSTIYQMTELINVKSEEITALYQFFTMLNDQLDKEQNVYADRVLKYAPNAIPLILRSLFYTGTVCLDNNSCNSCLDFYIPDTYFQEVKPIIVQTFTPEQAGKYKEYEETIAEDSTKLASMLTPYKPFYRYFNKDEVMATLVTEHDPNWKNFEHGNTQVGIRVKVEGISQNGGRNPRRIFVKPIKPDRYGQNVVQLCQNCFRLHDEDYRQRCNCGDNLIPVKLYPTPIVERVGSIIEEPERLSETLHFARNVIGQTIIRGAQVTYNRMQWKGDGYISKEEHYFEAIYQDSLGNPEPLQYTIKTRGIVWNLQWVVQHLIQDKELAQALNGFGKSLDANSILHTASHMLYKAIAVISGVSEQVLEYAISPNDQTVIVWERYEGGIGLSEIIRDVIREETKVFYRELLYSVLCPVHYSQQVRSSKFEDRNLQSTLAKRWALAEDDELLDSMITEAKAERYAIENAQAEIEASCVDGCPACVHIGMCTDRSEQKQIVSLKIAEKIMMYFRKNVFQEELDNMNDRRGLDGLEPVGLLKINTDRETFDVVCF